MYRPLQFFVGLRYTRAKRRNQFISFIALISMLGIAVGVTVLITVVSVVNGFETEVRARILATAAHATIFGYGGKLADWQRVIEASRADERVSGAAPFIRGEAMISLGQQVSAVQLQGVLPRLEQEVSELGQRMAAGHLTDLKPGARGIVLGRELAESLGVGMGDPVTLITSEGGLSDTGLLPRLTRYTVVGIFSAGMYEYDRGLALVHLDDAENLFRLGDAVTGVRLRMNDPFDAPSAVREVARGLGGGYLVGDWTRQHVNYFRALAQQRQMIFIILVLIVAVAAFNMVSTLVMVVTDKAADIAILRTLGATPVVIMGIFVVQGAVVGLVGTALGVIGGIALALNVETLVPALEHLMGMRFLSPEVYLLSELPSDLRIGDVRNIASVALVLSLAATLYPAWRAARMQPAEALRYE